ncbi:uncharacterized protein EI90DRAFT_3062137 [Cantharellus anzutake]|uniref:uncharacterized protein n=1 Tax=Cantharellus anzutake TaxID=1750568 RepID=UPI001905B51B|nr:uncharacterized protein EI90DRAFT_3062137 [Cantharellus anzutake]KAF8329828.1 hypothetical protein EI90DRAFT_3062137 [Cantharellus anzutake]
MIAEFIKPTRLYLPTLCAGSGVVCDILIAYSVISQLIGNKTGFRSTDRGIMRLITFTFSTGALSSIAACTIIVTFLTGLGSETLGFSYLLCRIYSNSLLASLNQRGSWFKHHDQFDSDWTGAAANPEKMCPSSGTSRSGFPTLNPSPRHLASNSRTSAGTGMPRPTQTQSGDYVHIKLVPRTFPRIFT